MKISHRFILIAALASGISSSASFADSWDHRSNDELAGWRETQPAADATALFLVNFEKDAFYKTVAINYAPRLAKRYKNSDIYAFEKDRVGSTRDEFLAKIEKAALLGKPIDLYIFSHGNSMHLWLTRLSEKARSQLRLVYNSGCTDGSQGPEWKALGAKAYVGHIGDSASPLFLRHFQAKWLAGETLQSAVEYGNTEARKDTQFPAFTKYAWGTQALITGDRFLHIYKNTPAAPPQQPTLTPLLTRLWYGSSAGRPNCIPEDGPTTALTADEKKQLDEGKINTVSCALVDVEQLKVRGDFRGKTILNSKIVVDFNSSTFLNFEGARLWEGTDFTTIQGNPINIVGSNFRNAEINAVKIENAIASSSRFERAQIRNSKFKGVAANAIEAAGASVDHSQFNTVKMQNSNWSKSQWNLTTIELSNLSAANFQNATFEEVTLKRVDLSNADLRGLSGSGTWTESTLKGADLRGAHLHKIKWAWENAEKACTLLEGAKFDQTTLLSESQRSLFKKCGIEEWREPPREAPSVAALPNDAPLREKNLDDAADEDDAPSRISVKIAF